MNVTIHQPEHLPWLGFFHKLNMADIYVVLDNVQFRKNYFQNRNKVRTADGWAWISVPVNFTLSSLIKDVTIASDYRWKRKWRDTIYFSYKKARYFNAYFEQLEESLNKNWISLGQFNISLLSILCNFLGIRTKFLMASQLCASGKGSDLVLDICKKTGATTYISGISGRQYLKLGDFKTNNIEITFQEFHHPIYEQLVKPFIPCMSVIDLLFNYGEESMAMINGLGTAVMQEVYE